MSTQLVKKQLLALTQTPDIQLKQSKVVKKQLQKELKQKAAEAKAKAERCVIGRPMRMGTWHTMVVTYHHD